MAAESKYPTKREILEALATVPAGALATEIIESYRAYPLLTPEDCLGLTVLTLFKAAGHTVYPEGKTLEAWHHGACKTFALHAVARVMTADYTKEDTDRINALTDRWLAALPKKVRRVDLDEHDAHVMYHLGFLNTVILPAPSKREFLRDGKRALGELHQKSDNVPFLDLGSGQDLQEIPALICDYQIHTEGGTGLFRGRDGRMHLSWKDMRDATARTHKLKRVKGVRMSPLFDSSVIIPASECTTEQPGPPAGSNEPLVDEEEAMGHLAIVEAVELVRAERAAASTGAAEDAVLIHLQALLTEEMTMVDLAGVTGIPQSTLHDAFHRTKERVGRYLA